MEKLYNTRFWLLIASIFLFSASFQMIIPELFDFLDKLGGSDYKGYIIALFTLTAGLSRPFSGKLTDTIGRMPVMLFGVIVCILSSALYPFVTSVGAFLTLRLFHGFSTGFTPTASTAFIADITPLSKRGEAMTSFAIGGSLGMSLGPAIGSWVTEMFSIEIMFAVSSSLAVIAAFILFFTMHETLPKPQKFTFKHLVITRHEIFEARAMPTFYVLFLVSLSYGAILTLMPDISKQMHINKGLFFTILTASSLVIRLFAGRSSDKYGRVLVLRYAAAGIIGAMILTAHIHNIETYYGAAIVFGASWGMINPTLQAWATDLVSAENRGKGLATMFIALEAGIGSGALVAGQFFKQASATADMIVVFYACAFSAILALVYLFFKKNTRLVA